MFYQEEIAAIKQRIADLENKLQEENKPLLPNDFGLDGYMLQVPSYYVDAIRVFLELRMQPGAEEVTNDTQYYLAMSSQNRIEVYSHFEKMEKIVYLSPFFNNSTQAREAINLIGEQQIIDMFKTFHSYKPL